MSESFWLERCSFTSIKLAELDPNTQRACSFGDGQCPSFPLMSVTVGVAQHCPDDAQYYNWKQFVMHCFQRQIQKAAQGLLRNPCLLIHWAKGRGCSLVSYVHSKALSKPLPLVWVAVASNQIFGSILHVYELQFLRPKYRNSACGKEFFLQIPDDRDD